MNNKDLQYAYFPGCASKYAAGEYNESTRIVFKKLGIKLIDLDFNCCGSGVLKEVDKSLNTHLNARNFALAEKRNLDIMTICSTCILNLRKDKNELLDDKETLVKANEILKQFDLNCDAKLNIKHMLWVLTDDFGVERLKEFKKVSFKKLKIAGYYGCHIGRPKKYFKNHKLDGIEKISAVFGGEPLDLKTKADCCGFHISLLNQKAANKMSATFMGEAIENDADLIVTVCPFCHLQLDVQQKEINKIVGKKKTIPILHLSQLVGLGIGLSPDKLLIKRHVSKFPKDLLN